MQKLDNYYYNVGAFKLWSEHEQKERDEGRERGGRKKDASPGIEPITFNVVD